MRGVFMVRLINVVSAEAEKAKGLTLQDEIVVGFAPTDFYKLVDIATSAAEVGGDFFHLARKVALVSDLQKIKKRANELFREAEAGVKGKA